MKTNRSLKLGITLAGVLALIVTSAHADTFGSGLNTFAIDFVNIGNAGNADDAGAGGGIYFSPYGGVPYAYRMGTYEISQAQIDTAKLAAPVDLLNVTAGAHTGNEPAANMQWYEAAAFVNWLNTSNGYQAAYNITFSGSWSMTLWDGPTQAWQAGGENLYRHKDAYYFLPSEDEWYKAAFHKNDGVTANYWDYATGSNTVPAQALSDGTTPFTAVFDGVEAGTPADPADVNLAGGLSAYLTMGQNGNVREWIESALTAPNDDPSEFRASRGADYSAPESDMRSDFRAFNSPNGSSGFLGFRVASVPEPSSTMLMLGTGMMFLLKRRRARSL